MSGILSLKLTRNEPKQSRVLSQSYQGTGKDQKSKVNKEFEDGVTDMGPWISSMKPTYSTFYSFEICYRHHLGKFQQFTSFEFELLPEFIKLQRDFIKSHGNLKIAPVNLKRSLKRNEKRNKKLYGNFANLQQTLVHKSQNNWRVSSSFPAMQQNRWQTSSFVLYQELTQSLLANFMISVGILCDRRRSKAYFKSQCEDIWWK